MPGDSTMVQAFIDNQYSLLTSTVSELIELYPNLNQAKTFSCRFDNSNTFRFSIAESVGISSCEHKNFLLGCTKVAVQFWAKQKLLQWVSQDELTLKSLFALQKVHLFFWVIALVFNVQWFLKEYDDWLFTKNVTSLDTTTNTDYQAYIDAKTSRIPHTNYSGATRSLQVSRMPVLSATDSDLVYPCSRELEQDKKAVLQTLLELLPTTKSRSRLTLLRNFLGKVQFWLQTVKKNPSKISYLRDVLDHSINRRVWRSGERKQRCTNYFQLPVSMSKRSNMRKCNATK